MPPLRSPIEAIDPHSGRAANQADGVLRVTTASHVQRARRRCAQRAEAHHVARAEPDRVVAWCWTSSVDRRKPWQGPEIHPAELTGKLFRRVKPRIDIALNVASQDAVAIPVRVNGID